MELTEFEALSFDCYGTLIDWESGIAAALRPWLDRERLDRERPDRERPSVPDWPAFADSPAALAALARCYRLIILSNVDRDSSAASNRRLGVTFTSVLTAQDIGSCNPSPRNFDALLAEAARLGIQPGRLLHVAQSLFHDHVPAQRAGLRTGWINRRHGRPGWGATPEPPRRSLPAGSSRPCGPSPPPPPSRPSFSRPPPRRPA